MVTTIVNTSTTALRIHPLLTRVFPPIAFLVSLLILLATSLAGDLLPAASAFAASVSSSSPPSSAAAMAAAAASTTVGPHVLRVLVQDASVSSQEKSLDLGGIVWLEHLNLVVGDMALAKKFYVYFLGLSRDDNPKHFNLGQQQFHLAASDDPPQIVTGSIGLTVPSLQRIRERVENAQSELEGTLFNISGDYEDNVMTVTCPWGNTFHLYDISVDDQHPAGAGSESSQKMVKLHAEGGAYGTHRMAVRGSPGIRYVEIACRAGTVDSIAEFYEKMLGCHVIRTRAALAGGDSTTGGSEAEAIVVCVGPGVHMTFVENRHLSDDIIKRMEGVHACFYIPSFQSAYDMLKDRNLIWTNPRFTHLDRCDTWEEARASRTFRFKDILDLKTGEKVLELEHETRPMLHGQYMKVPSYVPN
eukprot:CAMPEP_0172529222 /NCGR_PEP_ID=MMETSP1067-20121228/3361_1 /TAXON_ID=265564 ORGANISM="Thalassiosira punctigera, Strain Tpunct2005C2" /NCGR_SAMPLE_ID=MMETSP1067 /ASSEMBLY_ACC=CAM_ASM_000444 /LENGTH=415 /DNA_ID=CAMNT_0013313241 /DNA_START=21 /DNA_END=1268 /DNA_ORIENTATION=+